VNTISRVRTCTLLVAASLLALAIIWFPKPAHAAFPCTWAPGEVQVGENNGVPLCEQRGGSSQGAAPAGPQWASRWGAIAVDGAAGKFGGVEEMTSGSRAKKAAIKLCRQNGGSDCKIAAAYGNQCGALAWGDGKYASYSGPDYDKAIAGAVAYCSETTKNCKPYYAGCSFPVRVR
jgi:Domain of unknown function (DUF4189)